MWILWECMLWQRSNRPLRQVVVTNEQIGVRGVERNIDCKKRVVLLSYNVRYVRWMTERLLFNVKPGFDTIWRTTNNTICKNLDIAMKFFGILVALWATAVVADDSSSSSYSSSSGKALGSNLFVDSESTYYDGYQQAWRYLGWYVKCGSPSDRYSNQQHHSHSGDSSSEEDINHYCQRFLIWAAVSSPNANCSVFIANLITNSSDMMFLSAASMLMKTIRVEE